MIEITQNTFPDHDVIKIDIDTRYLENYKHVAVKQCTAVYSTGYRGSAKVLRWCSGRGLGLDEVMRMGPHEQTGALPGEGQTPQLPQHASTRRGGDQLHARRLPPEPEHADTQACDSSLQSREEKSVLKPPGLWFSVQQPERRHSGKCKWHLRIRPEVLRDTGCGQPASLTTLAGRTVPPCSSQKLVTGGAQSKGASQHSHTPIALR